MEIRAVDEIQAGVQSQIESYNIYAAQPCAHGSLPRATKGRVMYDPERALSYGEGYGYYSKKSGKARKA